jgi:hypothetical protein
MGNCEKARCPVQGQRTGQCTLILSAPWPGEISQSERDSPPRHKKPLHNLHCHLSTLTLPLG